MPTFSNKFPNVAHQNAVPGKFPRMQGIVKKAQSFAVMQHECMNIYVLKKYEYVFTLVKSLNMKFSLNINLFVYCILGQIPPCSQLSQMSILNRKDFGETKNTSLDGSIYFCETHCNTKANGIKENRMIMYNTMELRRNRKSVH